RAARLAEGHQELAVGAELVDLVPLWCGVHRRCWRRGRATGGGVRTAARAASPSPTAAERARAIDDPDVVVLVDGDGVRRQNQPGTKVSDQCSVRIELEDGIEHRAGAVV